MTKSFKFLPLSGQLPFQLLLFTDTVSLLESIDNGLGDFTHYNLWYDWRNVNHCK